MPLQSTGKDATERGMSAGFGLPMRDGDREVTVIVTHEALRAFAPDTPDAKTVLADNRGKIEAIASAKYDRGEIAKTGRILILPRDLAL